MRRETLVQVIAKDCPTIKASVDLLAKKWLTPVKSRLDKGNAGAGFPKVFNDPVWGTIEFMPWEVLLLDSPLVQRLRGVRQLGLAHFVYPGAAHDRLEHTRGVVEAAERMLTRLARNADHRRRFGARPDQAIPELRQEDHYTVRLAALLHDLGHGPFSHAIEPVIHQRYSTEFRNLSNLIRENFEGAGKISVSESVAVLIVLSDDMNELFNHNDFTFPDRKDLATRLVARIVGSRSHLLASYLSGVVSGPVDADKIDYMARDGHHAGLKIGLDSDRLLSKLEVITITPDNIPPGLKELRQRAEDNPQKRIYDMGIAISGVGAYEQMVIGRVVLYDRLYYHHKVRAADAMAQRLIQVAEEERGKQFEISELFLDVSDDTMIEILGGRLSTEEVCGGSTRARELADAIRERRIYHRALAFASRFVAGIDGFQNEQERDSERAALWRQVTRNLDTFDAIRLFEEEIFNQAQSVASIDSGLKDLASHLRPEHIIVDLPSNKMKPSGNLMRTRTENDEVGIPNLFFDPERWSNAYDQQKRSGYVFCPREQIPLVSLASRITIFKRFRISMTDNADRFAKTSDAVKPAWIDQLAKSGAIDKECELQLRGKYFVLSRITRDELEFPNGWIGERPGLSKDIADEIAISRPGGFPAALKDAVVKTIGAVARFVQVQIEGGEYAKKADLTERHLQQDLRTHLRTLGLTIQEGSEVGGGETDLLIDGQIVIENKIAGDTNDPMSDAKDYPFQARRYSIALCKTIFVTVVAYRPRSEAGHLQQSRSVAVMKVPNVREDCVEVRFAVPYGYANPSKASRKRL